MADMDYKAMAMAFGGVILALTGGYGMIMGNLPVGISCALVGFAMSIGGIMVWISKRRK